MVQRVYTQACRAKLLAKVMVATDDERIFRHVQSFGGEVMMTDQAHPTGTDRCAEVAKQMKDFATIINIQGDEPFIDPDQIDLVAATLTHAPQNEIATLVKQIKSFDMLTDPNNVKVVFDKYYHALYFSRAAIPYPRMEIGELQKDTMPFYKHIGIYGFKREILLQLATLPSGRLESLELLEQLRWLENGYKIRVAITDKETLGIDTPEDLEKALKKIAGVL